MIDETDPALHQAFMAWQAISRGKLAGSEESFLVADDKQNII